MKIGCYHCAPEPSPKCDYCHGSGILEESPSTMTTPNPAPDLKPCPFCGAAPKVNSIKDFHNISCQGGSCCNPMTGSWLTLDMAVRCWNTRAAESSLVVSQRHRAQANQTATDIWKGVNCALDGRVPTDKVEYLEMGTIRQMTRSQKRYQRYLDIGECFDSFLSFLRYESSREKEAA